MLIVNGSYITEMHITALVGGVKNKWANVSYWASELHEGSWGWRHASGARCADARSRGLLEPWWSGCDHLPVRSTTPLRLRAAR